MFLSQIIKVIAVWGLSISVASSAAVDSNQEAAFDICATGTAQLVESKMINGKPLQKYSCKIKDAIAARGALSRLEARIQNLCGAPCTTYCNSGTGGPDPHDCASIAHDLHGGVTIYPETFFSVKYASCLTYIINKAQGDQYECLDDHSMGGIINYLAFNCQASTGGGPYNGGSCHFYDNTGIGWVQVQST